jgi:hypothetical protein
MTLLVGCGGESLPHTEAPFCLLDFHAGIIRSQSLDCEKRALAVSFRPDSALDARSGQFGRQQTFWHLRVIQAYDNGGLLRE